jgi:hypothetical protein
LKVAEITPLEHMTLVNAAKHQSMHDLTPPDSIVYASVLHHLAIANTTSCFLNRNSKDFDDPDIVDALAKCGCKMLFNFNSGYDYIQSQVRSAGTVSETGKSRDESISP